MSKLKYKILETILALISISVIIYCQTQIYPPLWAVLILVGSSFSLLFLITTNKSVQKNRGEQDAIKTHVVPTAAPNPRDGIE